MFWAFVATLSSFVGNREIKLSNKTKEEIVEGFSLRLITLSRACEQSLEIETDLADSGAQSGSVSCSWLVILQMANCHIFPSQRVLYKKPFSTLKLKDQFYCCFRRNIHFGTDGLKHVRAFFYNYHEKISRIVLNRRGFLLICAQFVLHSAYS